MTSPPTSAPTPIFGDYPPERHVLRDLALESAGGDGVTAHGWIAVDEHTRGVTGLTHPGALATLVDAVGGGLAATAARPDWIATADLTLHLLPRPGVQRAQARGQVLRKGRTTVVIEVDLTTETGADLGLATMSFAILPRREGNPVIDGSGDVTHMTMAIPGSGFRSPIEFATGVTDVDPASGHVTLPLTDYVRNTLGAVQGGIMAMTAAAAAGRALTAAAGRHIDIVDLQVTYIALAKVGPVTSRATVIDTLPAGGTVDVELLDAGAADRLCTIVRARGVEVA